jgi:hypothetical protein
MHQLSAGHTNMPVYPGALRIADHWPGAREEGSVEQPASNVTPQVSRIFDNELQVDLKIASHLAT